MFGKKHRFDAVFDRPSLT